MITKEVLLKYGFSQQYYMGAPINYFVKNNVVFSLVNNQIETDNPNEFVCKCDNIEQLIAVYNEMTRDKLIEIK